jgi:hypothetical protein
MSYLSHRGLSSGAFAAEIASGGAPGVFHEVFVTYEGIGTARVQRAYSSAAPRAFAGYNVSLNGSVLATLRQTLTLTDLDTLVGFTAEPATVAEEIADLTARVTALENA